MYYVGFLKTDLRRMILFQSYKIPTQQMYPYFGKVIGPYESEREARNAMKVGKKAYGYYENPVKDLITKDKIRKAIKLTKKVIRIYKEIRKDNPGQAYHDQKFLMHMRDLEKYTIGSVPYISTLAKAYEQLESAKDSVEERMKQRWG